MNYKRKQAKWIKQDLIRFKKISPKTVTENWGKIYKVSWCEKYLRSDEYAQWYDNWCESFRK